MGLLGRNTVENIASKAIGLAESVTTDKDAQNDIKKEIMLAEIESDNAFLKMARPAVIWTGIFLIVTEIFGVRFYTLAHLFEDVERYKEAVGSSTRLLQYFLVSWTSVTTVYAFGRSKEKVAKSAKKFFGKK